MSMWKCECLVCECECESEVDAKTLLQAKQCFIVNRRCFDLEKPSEVRAKMIER